MNPANFKRGPFGNVVERLFPYEGVEGNAERLDRVETKLSEMNERLVRVEDFLKPEIPAIRSEVGGLRKLLSNKADLARLEALEARVDRLERAAARPAP